MVFSICGRKERLESSQTPTYLSLSLLWTSAVSIVTEFFGVGMFDVMGLKKTRPDFCSLYFILRDVALCILSVILSFSLLVMKRGVFTI